MAFWLAPRGSAKTLGTVKRFDPRYWTIDFPRPMMASIVTTAPDALRIDAVFYRTDDLAGLIWAAEDESDHPLLAYETSRDFTRCRLSFRWRSQGLKPLDAVHGPTLTIEGRDESGNARSWFVRLWNYAEGTAEDALIPAHWRLPAHMGAAKPDELVLVQRRRHPARRGAGTLSGARVVGAAVARG